MENLKKNIISLTVNDLELLGDFCPVCADLALNQEFRAFVDIYKNIKEQLAQLEEETKKANNDFFNLFLNVLEEDERRVFDFFRTNKRFYKDKLKQNANLVVELEHLEILCVPEVLLRLIEDVSVVLNQKKLPSGSPKLGHFSLPPPVKEADDDKKERKPFTPSQRRPMS